MGALGSSWQGAPGGAGQHWQATRTPPPGAVEPRNADTPAEGQPGREPRRGTPLPTHFPATLLSIPKDKLSFRTDADL